MPAARLWVVTFVAAMGLGVPAAASAAEWTLGPDVRVSYVVHHPLHEVLGISRAARLLKPLRYDPAEPLAVTGVVDAAIQVDWASFDSGNGNRDANTRSVVKASQFPAITFVFEKLDRGATTADGRVVGEVAGRMYVAGVKRPVTAAVELRATAPDRLDVTVAGELTMTAFGIEPPSLLMIAADDRVRYRAELSFVPAR